jgi:hypothetical protein
MVLSKTKNQLEHDFRKSCEQEQVAGPVYRREDIAENHLRGILVRMT